MAGGPLAVSVAQPPFLIPIAKWASKRCDLGGAPSFVAAPPEAVTRPRQIDGKATPDRPPSLRTMPARAAPCHGFYGNEGVSAGSQFPGQAPRHARGRPTLTRPRHHGASVVSRRLARHRSSTRPPIGSAPTTTGHGSKTPRCGATASSTWLLPRPARSAAARVRETSTIAGILSP